MNKIFAKKRIFLLLAIFVVIQPLSAQTYDELIANTMTGKDITMLLPPIAELQSQAEENSPLLKLYDADIVINNLKIKLLKKEWIDGIGIEAGAKYGLFDNLILTSDLGLDDVATSTTEQTRYNVGVSLKIPFSVLFAKEEKQIVKIEIDKLKYQKESGRRELRQLIIVQYNNIVKAHRNLVVQNNSVELYRVQMIRAQKDFSNGSINVADYARLNDMLSGAVMNLESTKIEYIIALQLLQEAVGVKIELLN
jgi:outer membrane protein TolC